VLIARHSDIPFDTALWRESPDDRHRMTKSLMTDHIGAGQSYDAVIRLLGNPDAEPQQPSDPLSLVYYLGRSGLDEHWLQLDLKNDAVVTARVRSS